MAFLKWTGYVILACLVVAAILGVILVIRMLAFVIAIGVAVALIALLLRYIHAARPRSRGKAP